MAMSLTRPFQFQSEEVIQKLVESLQTAETVDELQQNCSQLTKHVDNELSKIRSRLTNQISFLKMERNEALEKQQSTEAQVKSLKKQIEMMQTEYKLVDKARTKSLQSQLQAAIKERDAYKKKVEELDDICESLQIVSSLQKSMSETHRENESTIKELQASLDQANLKCSEAMKQRDELFHKLAAEQQKTKELRHKMTQFNQ